MAKIKKQHLLFIENKFGQFKGLGFNKSYLAFDLVGAKKEAYRFYDKSRFKITKA